MIHVTKSHQQQNMSEYTGYNTGQMKLLNKWDQCFDFHCDWVYGSRLNRTCQATWQVVDTWPTLLAPFVSVFLTYPPFPFIPSTAHPYPHSLILSSLLPFQSGVYFATSHCWYCLGTWSSSGRNTPETKPPTLSLPLLGFQHILTHQPNILHPSSTLSPPQLHPFKCL